MSDTGNVRCDNDMEAKNRSVTFVNMFVVVLKTVSTLWGFSTVKWAKFLLSEHHTTLPYRHATLLLHE